MVATRLGSVPPSATHAPLSHCSESGAAESCMPASRFALALIRSVATVIAAAKVARNAGAVVMLNASPAGAKPHDLLALSGLADVVVVNEAEAREWHWPVPHLVITRGSRGASYLGEDERFDVPSPAVEAVDTSGAGDVFAGVLAAGWSQGHEAALRRACAAGALSTLVPGAGDCAPYAEAIDDAVTNPKAGERRS